MHWISRFLLTLVIAAAFSSSAEAQQVEVDISACQGMYAVLEAMRGGAPKEKVSGMLDSLLETRPYQVMFKHYNRSWRPNHLPKPVFKRMILSLQFPEEYSPGENERADQMRQQWNKFYPNLGPYEKQLRQLESANLDKLINEGVGYAQTWLPHGWTIPNFYFVVIPNGGSPAFTIEGSQGYDFLQLAQDKPGEIDINLLVGTVAHESHHLGMRLDPPTGLSSAELMAYRVITLCIPEGAANYFISGSPPGRAPAFPDAHFHVYTQDLTQAWNEHLTEEEDMVRRQADLLDRAIKGELSEDAFNAELRDYWLNGKIGRAYVLGSEIFGAIYAAFGKKTALSVMEDPRKFFELYNAALKKKTDVLRRCVRVPNKAVKQASSLGVRN